MENITVTEESPARRAAVAGLAVVGFFALVFIGMVLAIYAARFVPKTASGLSSAAAYLSSVFTPAGTPTLNTVPSQVAFPVSTTTVPATVATTTATTTAPTQTAKPASTGTTAGHQTTSAQILNGAAGTNAVYSGPLTGLPNLVGTITAVGYLDANGNFIPASTVLNSQRLAVKFTVSNAGTNVSGPWNFNMILPTKASSRYNYTSIQQQSLNPGDHIDFTLHLDAAQALTGSNTITLTVDPNNQIVESSEANTVTAPVTVSNQN